MEKLCDRREKLCLNFAKKCVNNPKTTHMFPKNIKLHDMKTRNPEKFLVQHALNDRLKRSPITYMQNLMNSHKVQTGKRITNLSKTYQKNTKQ